MSEKDIKQLVEILYPYFKEKLKKDGFLKNYVQRKNATIVSSLVSGETNINENVDVILPYDTQSFSVKNETGIDLQKDDLVCIEYSVDLKNAIAVYKVN